MPPGMSKEEYQKALKRFNNPDSLYDPDVKRIEQYWEGTNNERLAKDTILSEKRMNQGYDKQQKASEEIFEKKMEKRISGRPRTTQDTVRSSKHVTAEDINEFLGEAGEKVKKKATKQKTKQVNVKGLTKIDLPADKLIDTVSDVLEGPTPLQSKVMNATPKIMRGAALYVGAATLLSGAMKLKDKAEVKQQTRESEKNIKEKEKKAKEQREKIQNKNSYGRVIPGDIVMDLFNERIGHHKMGNNRF